MPLDELILKRPEQKVVFKKFWSAMPSPIAQFGHPKMGGIKKGTKHRSTIVREALNKAIAAGGPTPLDIMREFAGDTKLARSLRLEAAKAAAPYLHRKMPQQIELRNVSDLTDEELRRIAEGAAVANAADDSDDE